MIYVEMLSLNTDKKNLPIAITMGDPSGINSEIILKSFNKINNNKEIDFFIMSYGDYDRYQDCLLIAKEAGIIVEKYDDYLILANEKNFSAL